ncbi:MAG TPA: transposase, partial [Blastocatellia bacterium]|nr:transposase [Blastocatellia bacterium]
MRSCNQQRSASTSPKRVDQAAIDHWLCSAPPTRRGRPLKYADAAIRCCLLLRQVFHLPLRQTQGLASSL